MTARQLTRLCTLWQKRLRLQDWRIAIRFGDAEEVGSDNWGIAQYHTDEMRATIVIRADIDIPEYEDSGIESTLLHEILHITIHGHRFDKRDVQMERAINQITDCLLEGYKRRKKR